MFRSNNLFTFAEASTCFKICFRNCPDDRQICSRIEVLNKNRQATQKKVLEVKIWFVVYAKPCSII